ncbi:MAG: asparagine synthase (glutamine-hydrolyzing) [Rhodospirillales bacterium]
MGGIAGLMTGDGRSPHEATLKGLAQAIGHRGPDARGTYLSGSLGMVHARLAVVALENGDQPLYAQTAGDGEPDGDGWIALIADGDIYNAPELRLRLGDDVLTTGSDCEPPLHLYLKQGTGFVDHLRGMYALAIHDPGVGTGGAGRLVLCRDPFGIKPLYYAETRTGLAFASEAQALIASGLVAPRLDAEARDELLQLQFTTGRHTLFAGIERLLPGETLAVEGGRIVERCRVQGLPDEGPQPMTEALALEELDRQLNHSILVHQRTDAPYGMFLSGGIDSSVLLAIMDRLNADPVTAFTACFPGAAGDNERGFARAVSRATGSRLIEVECREQDLWRLLPDIAACIDDPAIDYAAFPSYCLAAAAREAGIRVILSGEGGDEVFGGYGRYRRALRPRLLGGQPMRATGLFDRSGVLRSEGGRWRAGILAAKDTAAGVDRTPLQTVQAEDFADWLPNGPLTILDRTLMAHGVEGRVPFIDRHLAAFAFRLPDRLKLRRGTGKLLLRRWLTTGLPAAQPFERRRGLTMPVVEWLAGRGGDLGPLVAAEPGVREACRPGAVESLFASVGGDERAARAAWTLLVYALWHRRHILEKPPEGDVFETLAAAP